MSHKNYNKMYNKPETKPVVEEQVEVVEEVFEPAVEVEPEVPEVIEEPIVEAEPEVVTGPALILATVVGCARLNVRKEPSPDADVVTIINASEVLSCYPEPVGNYYNVITASGTRGYCVKEYLKLK